MREEQKQQSILFRAFQAAYVATVLPVVSALVIGSWIQSDSVISTAALSLGSLFLLGGLWVVFSKRASHSTSIKRCVYLAFVVFIVFSVVTRHDRAPNDSEEDLCWSNFKYELTKDPSFRGITIRYFRSVYWVEGSLKSEADLERLIALAHACGINDRRLDGPYVHSVSITIPGTKDRSETYH